VGERFATTPTGRENAMCPACHCLERHRFMVLLLAALSTERPPTGIVIDVAPSRQVSPLIKAIRPQGYLSIDFDPGADGRLVDVAASLTDLPVRDASTSLLVCYHVLEHVPDDHKAMSEIGRVLASDGVALLQVPWRNRETDEDPSAGPAERLERFGQADHVRFYGTDFVSRLEKGGLAVTELTPQDVLPADLLPMLGLIPNERVWICTRADSEAFDVEAVRRRLPEALTAALRRMITATGADAVVMDNLEGLRVARADAALWRKRYEGLRNKLPVRAMIAVRRPFVRGSAR
jgi:SAM-dependent methyltransferase